MYRPAEIRDFEVSPQVDEQVFWLNVSVNDFLGVAVVKGVGQLCHVLRDQDGTLTLFVLCCCVCGCMIASEPI